MLISELELRLRAIREEHGDLEVRVESDYDGLVEYPHPTETTVVDEPGTKKHVLLR